MYYNVITDYKLPQYMEPDIGISSYPLCSRVFMLNPRVGEIIVISSPLNFFTIVVLPALSKPLNQNG